MPQQQPADKSTPHHASPTSYPHGRGYGHDYMRGGEIFGGYGYSARDEYERRRGEADSVDDVTDGGERRRTAEGGDGVS